MKKFIVIILAVLLILSMVACQTTSESSIEASNSDSENTVLIGEEEISEESNEKEQRGNCDFRNAKWGDSKEDVKKYEVEIEDFIESGDSRIGGEVTVSGYQSVAIFNFENDKLYSGIYSFPLNYSNAGQYIPVYNILKENLIEKYGEPSYDAIIPLADEKLIEIAGEARALQLGYVQYGAIWELKNSSIQLVMSAQNYDITLAIIYTDNNYKSSSDNGL